MNTKNSVPTCSPRIDTLDTHLLIGDEYVEIDLLNHVPYRFRTENDPDSFEVFFENKWQEAFELDFETD